MNRTSFPRVNLPGVSDETRALLAEFTARQKGVDDAANRNRRGIVKAMRALGREPYLGHVWHEPKPTRHVRGMRRRAAAAAVIASRKAVQA